MENTQDRISKRKRALEKGRQVRSEAHDLKTRGYSNSAIAHKIGIPESTVRRLLADWTPSDDQQ